MCVEQNIKVAIRELVVSEGGTVEELRGQERLPELEPAVTYEDEAERPGGALGVAFLLLDRGFVVIEALLRALDWVIARLPISWLWRPHRRD